MKCKIIWTEFAVFELKSIFDYHKVNVSLIVAKKIKTQLLQTVRILETQSLAGQIEENLLQLNQNHRFLIEGNYKIIYRQIHNKIYITDIFDCRQNPQKLKSNNI